MKEIVDNEIDIDFIENRWRFVITELCDD